MKKYIFTGVAITVGIILYDLFLGMGMSAAVFPVSGGTLCGPICPPTGPSYWEKPCHGIEVSERYVSDSSTVHCLGFVSDDKRCYGRGVDDGKGAPIEKISCLNK